MQRWIWMLGLTVWLAAGGGPARGADVVVPEGVEWLTGLEYSNPDDQHLQLNLARPKNGNGPFPAVVCIHGGGFRAGSRESYNKLCLTLAERGYVAVTVTYRLAPKFQFPAAVHDVKAAVRWLRANAKKYNVDPERIGTTGGSAGGHLAQFLGLTADVRQFEGTGGNPEQSSRVACVVNVYGPSDFTKSYGASVDAAEVLPLFLGGNLEQARQRHILSSPLYWVTPDAAPTLCIHGTEDKYVAHEQAVWLIDRLKAAAVDAELLTLTGAGHGFKGDDAVKEEQALLAYFDRRLKPAFAKKVMATAYAVPKETTTEGSGYFSIIEGKNGRIYIGTAKYRHNAYLVEFDPASKQMKIVLDAHKEIGTTATGFAAQAKFHTRNNVGPSGKIYLGTKQGYPQGEEKRTDYPGGYPMVFDPETGKTRVYPIPVPHQGIISVTPDESRNVAYISTCSDERPTESTHFLALDLQTGSYRDLLDCRHMYAFVVVDHLGRAYHPILGGEIARYDPRSAQLQRLKQTIDGQPPTADSRLAHPESHPINWDVTPDHKTLYAVAMSTNQLYAYDLTADGDTLAGKSLGKLLPEAKTVDCRAMCVGPKGQVWAAVSGQFADGGALHLVTYAPGDAAPQDRGAIVISNPNYTEFKDGAGKDLPWHQGMRRMPDGSLVPIYHMGVCEAHDGRVYVTAIAPLTLLQIDLPKSAP